MPTNIYMESVCLVAILKDEEKFLDEWILYHRLIGIDHFYLYDDDPNLPLETYLSPHWSYITVIPWYDRHNHLPGRNRQTKAYKHACDNFVKQYSWVTFIDADEFIILRKHDNIKSFLTDFKDASAVSLNWHVFGHNGFYDDPKGLITSELTRRMFAPNRNVKTITRSKAIENISTAHFCKANGRRVDANNRLFSSELYPGKTERAHINHYQCRSFKRWMDRVKRGDPSLNDEPIKKDHYWRVNEEACLKQFVTTVAFNKNEYIDEYMLKYKVILEQLIKKLGR